MAIGGLIKVGVRDEGENSTLETEKNSLMLIDPGFAQKAGHIGT